MTPFIVGLSGGIASGKTAVSDYLHSLGVPIIDADSISRKLLQGSLLSAPNNALLEVRKEFGAELFDNKGLLIRARLRDVIFHNEQKKQRLEAIIHPQVYHQIKIQLAQIDDPYVIVSIPLLAESSELNFFDRIAIVDVSEEVQISRCHERDKTPLNTIKNIIVSQASRQERLKIADDIIDNSTDLTALYKQLDILHLKYLSLTDS